MRILVIGGTYFLGRIFVDKVYKEHEVTLINRGNAILPKDTYGTVTQHICDRHDEESISNLRENRFDVVVDFCAYREGDINTVLRALDYNVGQYIFISTCDVYVRGTGKILDESAPFEERDFGGEVGDYITGKVALEKELKECTTHFL